MSSELDEFDAFGLPLKKREDLDFLKDEEPQEEQAPVEPVEAEEEVEQVEETPPEEPEGEEEVPEPEAEEEAPAEEETVEELIFGKYKNLEEAEKGYKNLQELQFRTANQRREMEELWEQARLQGQQLEQGLRQAAPYIQQQQAQIEWLARQLKEQGIELPAQTQEQMSRPQQRAISPQDVDRIVQSRMQQAQEMQRIEADARSTMEAAEQALTSFYESHPEVEVRGDIDSALYHTVLDLEDSWKSLGVEDYRVGIDNPEMLEVVYEAYKNPSLLTVIKKYPHLVDDDEGMELARFQAAMLRGETPVTQDKRKVPASQVGQKKPVVEKASVGSRQPESGPQDDWDRIKAASRKARSEKQGSPFFE